MDLILPDGSIPGERVYIELQRAPPANWMTSSNRDGSRTSRLLCQQPGCSCVVLTGGDYCLHHKKTEGPIRPETSATATKPHETREISPIVEPLPARSPRINGHSVEAFGGGKTGDATITVNTSRQPMLLGNSKKQLPGKSIARKSAGGSRSTPKAGFSPEGPRTSGARFGSSAPFPDPRPPKRPRQSPVNNVDSEKDQMPSEIRKADGTASEGFSLRPKVKTNVRASKSIEPNVENNEANSPTKNIAEEKRPPARDSTPVSPSMRIDNRHKRSNGGQTQSKIHSPRATKNRDVTDVGGYKNAPARSKPTEVDTEAQSGSRQASAPKTKGHSDFRDNHRNGNPSLEQAFPRRGQKPLDRERNSEPLQSQRPSIIETEGSRNNISHGATRSEPGSDPAVSANGSNGVNSIHTQARFAIHQTPSQRDRKGAIARTSPTSTSLNGGTDSDTPLTRDMPKARFSKGMPTTLRSEATISHSTTEPTSRSTSVTMSENRKANGLGSFVKDVNHRIRRHHKKALSADERRKLAIEKHDPDKFDSYIYGKPNEPFRPGSELFNMPWYEQPPRPIRPATHFGYFDPRVHWSQPKSDQWYRDKQTEITQRGGRKARIGKAAASVARRKIQDQRANRRVNLPDRVANNPKWMAALDELDRIIEANRLRELEREPGGPGPKKQQPRQQQRQPQQHHQPQQQQEQQQQQQEQQQHQQYQQQQQYQQHQYQQLIQQPQQQNQLPQRYQQQPPPLPPPYVHEREENELYADDDEVEYESPSISRRRRRGRKKGKEKATMMMDEDDYDYDGGDDEYVGVVSDLP